MIYLLSIFLSAAFADFGIIKLKGNIEDCQLAFGQSKARLIKAEDTIKEGACLSSSNGYIVLKKNGYIMSAKGPFKITVSSKKPNLEYGKVRFDLQKIKDFKLQTRNAVVGVRGTDFFVSYQPELGETEVICFESTVQLSDLDGQNTKQIPAGYWGGKGGRFGIEITEPIRLEKSFLNTIKSDLEI